MTGPRRAERDNNTSLAPVRRRGVPAGADSYTESDVARGQADAVLGALGRMQLRLDLLSREQSESLGMITQVLEQVLERLDAMEAPYEDEPETS